MVRLGLVKEQSLKRLFDKKILENQECKEMFERLMDLMRSGTPKTQLMQMYPDLFAKRSMFAVSIEVFLLGLSQVGAKCMYSH